MNDLLLTYYGDDFTGSTDVMESLELYGIPTVLFLAMPTRAAGRAFPAGTRHRHCGGHAHDDAR